MSGASSGSSCSQKRKTVQPAACRSAFVSPSRTWLESILSAQNSLFARGRVPCKGQPCQ